jgi:hypothetical protein
MGLIEPFNFLLSNCKSPYEHFNNILSCFVENLKSSEHQSIGSSTEKIILSSLSQLYLLFKSITREPNDLYQNSALETMINIINSSISYSLQNISTYFLEQYSNISSTKDLTNHSLLNIFDYLLNYTTDSNQSNKFSEKFQTISQILSFIDPTININESQSNSEIHNIFITKFNQFIDTYKKIYFTLTGSKIKLSNIIGLSNYQNN